MKCFILGSNSFAGAAYVDFLLNKGYQVCGISRSEEPNNIFLNYKNNPELSAFQLHVLDLNHDFEQIVSLLKSFKPNYIVDFAGQGMVAESWLNPEQWYQTNIVAKVKLHNVLKDFDKLDKYIRVSTPEVYGDSEQLIDENANYNPSTPYAVSHVAIDLSLKAFNQQYGFPVVFARFANFFGPHQQLYRIVPRTILYALLGETLFLHGGGTSIRAFIHSYDVSTGLYQSMLNGIAGDSYHFSTKEFVSIRELVEKICAHINIPFNSFVKISEDRLGKDKAYLMDCNKARTILDWQPKYLLEDGIAQTIDWIQSNMSIIKNLPYQYIHKP